MKYKVQKKKRIGTPPRQSPFLGSNAGHSPSMAWAQMQLHVYPDHMLDFDGQGNFIASCLE
ncbi:unnamed protein product [Penicillium camemberti]|uniref:Str. FM013 n=1 Tax=Penicillium camemberti (strain FM 013) TaxID=1429867 RepID=A0A0G4PNQ6_PENC3|nr:unnamed protein product [Penicillium camemberti]